MTRTLALVALVLLVGPTAFAFQSETSAVSSWSSRYWVTRGLLEEQAPERNADIAAELKEIGDHPWAGVYRERSRWGLVLRMAPEAGYTLLADTGCATCGGWRGMGRIVSSDHGENLNLRVELGLEPHPDFSPDNYYGMESILHLVRWGDLLFAVPPRRMELFCAEVSDGFSFPSAPFRYTGSEADFDYEKTLRPEGDPKIPEQYRHLLLTEPKACSIRELVELRERTGFAALRGPTHDAVYSLDAGSEDGIRVGMRLYLQGDGALQSRGRVEQVDARTGRVVFEVQKSERAQAEAMAGHRATTLHPRANQERR